jgi:hypothetical protein
MIFGSMAALSLIAMVVTTWGIMALSTKPDVVQLSYWTGAYGRNATEGKDLEFTLYVGLRSFQTINCGFERGLDRYPSRCDREVYLWNEHACEEGIVADACTACRGVAKGMWTTAFFSWFTLILSFVNNITRMNAKGDAPVQKLIGCVSETWGFLSLLGALANYNENCLHDLTDALDIPNVDSKVFTGPGVYCYAICCATAAIRGIFHWLTPIPHADSVGCFGSSRSPIAQSPDHRESELVVKVEPASY